MSRNITAVEVAARLERLPMTWCLWRLVLVAGGAWFVESLSIGATGVVLPVLKPLWHLSAGQTGLLAVASTIGVVVGLIPAGRLADRWGRVRLLTWGITAYGGLTLLSALAPNFGALALLRFLAGLAMGGVFPLPYSIIAELVPKSRRTWLSGVLDACLSVGYFSAPLLGLAILPHWAPTVSWRVFMGAAGLPLLYAGLVRRILPESPRWLLRQGRPAEAEAAVQALEAGTRRYWRGSLPKPDLQGGEMPPGDATHAPGFWRAMTGRTVVAAAAATGTFFLFYVVMTYTPTIFTALHVTLTTALGFAAVVTGAAVPGKILNGWLAERWGRKPVFAVFMGLAAGLSLLFAAAHSPTARLVAAAGMSLFGTGAFPGLKMFYAEQYPTPWRVTGASAVEATARTLGGIVGAAIMPAVWHGYGIAASFDLIAAVAGASVLVMLVWAAETRGLTLEAIEASYAGRRSQSL
jgi:putative MFS transporter